MTAAALAPELEPISFSNLKWMAKSPAHYRHASRQLRTAAMQRGSAVDYLLFGGRQVVAFPGKQRRGKEWEAFEAAHPGHEILTAADFERATSMAAALRAHPEAMRLLEGKRRAEIDWKYLGRTCVSHPDVYGPGRVVDLKTSQTSEPGRFTNQAIRMGYHAQLAFYRMALVASGLAEKPPEAFVVAVESSAPYPVVVLRLTDRALDFGERLVRLWFERLLACEASGSWPGYVESTVALDVPEDLELTFEPSAASVPIGSEDVPF